MEVLAAVFTSASFSVAIEDAVGVVEEGLVSSTVVDVSLCA